MLWLSQLVIGVTTRKAVFNSMPVRVGFKVEKALGKAFLQAFRLSPADINPPVLRVHQFIYRRRIVIWAVIQQRT